MASLYELMSGISPFSYIIWAPVLDLEDNSGVYYFNQKRSLKVEKEEEKGIVNGPKMILSMMSNQETEKIRKFGQAVVFNTFLLHGNTVFNSN